MEQFQYIYTHRTVHYHTNPWYLVLLYEPKKYQHHQLCPFNRKARYEQATAPLQCFVDQGFYLWEHFILLRMLTAAIGRLKDKYICLFGFYRRV